MESDYCLTDKTVEVREQDGARFISINGARLKTGLGTIALITDEINVNYVYVTCS